MAECVILSSDDELEIIEIKRVRCNGIENSKLRNAGVDDNKKKQHSPRITAPLISQKKENDTKEAARKLEILFDKICQRKEVEITPKIKPELSTATAPPCNQLPKIEPAKIDVTTSESKSSKNYSSASSLSLNTSVINKTPEPSTSKQVPSSSKDEKKISDKRCDPALKEESEARSLFKKFLSLCGELDKSEDMTAIKKRLRRYHSMASPEYLCSNQFKTMLTEEIEKFSLKKSKHKLFPSLKKVLEALKANPYLATTKLRKLQHMLKKVQKTIQKLEEEEVTSDNEDSAYIQLDRWNKKAVSIYNKICELMDKPADAERQYLRKVSFSGSGSHQVICRALEKFYNKTRKFPDFYDVTSLVKATNEKESMGLTPGEIYLTAQKIFLDFGAMLQRRRCYDDYSIMVEYVNEDACDPALEDENLMKKLDENKRLYHGREKEVLDHYASKEIMRNDHTLNLKEDVKPDKHKKNEDESDNKSCAESSDGESEGEKLEEEEEESDASCESSFEEICSGKDNNADEKSEKQSEVSCELSDKNVCSKKDQSADENDKKISELLCKLSDNGVSSEKAKSAAYENNKKRSFCSDIKPESPTKRMKHAPPTHSTDTVKPEHINDSTTVEIKKKNCPVSDTDNSAVMIETKTEGPEIEIIEIDMPIKCGADKKNDSNSLNHSGSNASKKNNKTKTNVKEVIDLDDNCIDLTDDNVSLNTSQTAIGTSSGSNSKVNNTPKKDQEKKPVPIIIEGKHPLIITEQSTIFISRSAKIFKRIEKKPTSTDVIVLD